MFRRNLKKTTITLLTAMMLAGNCVPFASVQAATEHYNDAAATQSASWSEWKTNWDSYSSDYENVSLTPGTDETKLNFAWYSKTSEKTKIRISTNQDMSSSTQFAGSQETAVEIDGTQYYANKATAKGLKENTTYYYQVWKNGAWSEAETYSTKSFNNYSFLYVGDPQIGASRKQTDSEGTALNGTNKVTTTADENLGARNDGYNWNNILTNAVKNNANLSFMVSAGDQVNYSQNEREYAAYLGADALTSLPVATTIGNHDSTSNQYSLHYNNPNEQTETATTKGATAAGTDYYYRYGNTLFIVLDTNNYNCTTHENVIKKAVSENQDAKWKVVTFHQDIYGSGYDHSDSDGMVLRTQLTPIMDEYDIDVVLQGHDHTYSRTYQLQSDGKTHSTYNDTRGNDDTNAEYQAQNNCYEIVNTTKGGTVTNPEGTVYLEANSATGSKFYNLIGTQQNYISERSQTWTPSYSVVNVTDDSFSVTAYDATTNKELEGSSTYTIVKKEEAAVTQKNQTITATSSYKKAYGSKVFSLNAKTNGNGALSYASSNKKVVTVDSKGKVSIRGTGKATITVKAAATDTYKAATKSITITVVPKKQSVRVSNKTRRQLKIKWKKDSKASGYVVSYATKKNFSNGKTVRKSKSTTSYTVKKLRKGKKYYVRVRAYKTINGKRYYGAYSNVKKVTVK